MRREVRNLAAQLCANAPELLNELEREQLIEEVMSEVFGLGPLDPLMTDPTITDILVNGPHSVYVERQGKTRTHRRSVLRRRPSAPDHPASGGPRRPASR